jgi:hypothetical protein
MSPPAVIQHDILDEAGPSSSTDLESGHILNKDLKRKPGRLSTWTQRKRYILDLSYPSEPLSLPY